MKLFKTMFPLYLFFCLSLMGIATAQDDNELTKDDFSQIFGDGPNERQAYESMVKIVKEVSKELMELDKKIRNNRLRYILPTGVGSCRVVDDIAVDEIITAMKRGLS